MLAGYGPEGDPVFIDQCVKARQINPRGVPGTPTWEGRLINSCAGWHRFHRPGHT